MKVYVVEHGEYSSHTFHSIHSTMERAQKVVDRLHHDGWSFYHSARVSEWEVDAYAVPQVPNGMSAWRVWIAADGSVKARSDAGEIDTEEDAASGDVYEDREGTIYVAVFARDQDHAVKIASDRRAQYLAEREGVA